jgi:hypothetical protein
MPIPTIEQQQAAYLRQEKEFEAVLSQIDDIEVNKDMRVFYNRFAPTFAQDVKELTGIVGGFRHDVDTGTAGPIHSRFTRADAITSKAMREEADNMVEQNRAIPSISDWSSKMVIVAKKDGGRRACVNYRGVNRVTKKDAYPLPRIDDIIESLKGNKFFTSLDLMRAFWQVVVNKEDRHKLAFQTHNGLYEPVFMPFGLCNAPATFQRVLDTILSGLEWEECCAYVDDIIIFSKSWPEHLERLYHVFERLEAFNVNPLQS